MERTTKATQYGYSANAALVITTERGKRDFSAASEVTSIASHKSAAELMKEMGSRAGHSSNSKESAAEKEKRQKKRHAEEEELEMRKRTKKGALDSSYAGLSSVLTADVEQVYHPLTRETKAVYETLLTYLQAEMGDKPSDVLASAAEEVLAVVKDDSITVKDQQRDVEELFGHKLDADRFRQLINIGKKITDFKSASEQAEAAAAAASSSSAMDTGKNEDALDEKLGVGIVFGEDDEEEEDNNDHAANEMEDDEEDGDEADADAEADAEGESELAAAARVSAQMDTSGFKMERQRSGGDKNKLHSTLADKGIKDEEDDDISGELDARTIDAHWIQRQVSAFQSDAFAAQKIAADIFQTLSDKNVTDAQAENVLVTNVLGFEHFALIKKLLRNRWKIIYSIRMLQAGDDEKAKNQLIAEMESDEKLKPIWKNLQKTTQTAAERNTDFEKTLLKEARSLDAANRAKQRQQQQDDDADGDVAMEESKEAPSSRAASSKVAGDRTSDAFWSRRAKALIDLDSLSSSTSHQMASSQSVQLPKNSEIINKPAGYQEVHIPPAKPQPFGENEALVQIADMPSWAQPAFSGMKELNRVQSRVYPTAMKSPENMLVCAPTGAGKTNVAMLTMLREIGLHQKSDGTFNLDAFKIIYVAPMKSLVQEMVLNFGNRLKPYGITVKELSGDQQMTKEEIAETQVIVTTPEKYDVVSRRSIGAIPNVKLILIDEVHLLHDSRGAVLECIVARTIRQIETTQELIRLVGLSATLPNYEDVAMFLRVKPDKGLFFFDATFRPVPLQQQFIGITTKKAFKRFQLMNEICYEKVIERAGTKQMLIFVHSRKETATTAKSLRDQALANDELGKFIKDDARRELLSSMAEDVKYQALKELLPYGLAIHHAGMTRGDRTLVEELFDGGHIQVLVCTATLAWGVNLPASCCIIKGTQVYDSEIGGWKELSMLDVQQMQGRAGRPQYDVMGEAILLTSHKELHWYLSLLNAQLPVESQFIAKLADNLNAEIVLGTVSNVREAVTWLGYTYLYVRMLRKPGLYGISAEQAEADPYLEQRRLDLIHTAATILDRNHLIKYDKTTGQFQVTDLGRVASTYYVTHQSLSVFNDYLKPQLSDIELFRVFSLSSEFKNISVREEEKIELAKLIDKVPIPLKESIDEPSAKVNTLLQAFISRLSLEGFALMADMVYITQSAARIMRALFEIVLKRGWAAAALKCLTLCKMIDHRMWSAQSPLRQFESKIPADIVKRIESKDFTWEQLYDLEAPAIGELVRFPKMGKTIYQCIHQVPRLELTGSIQPITRSTIRVELTLTPDFQFDASVHGNAEPFWIFVEDVDGEVILHSEYFLLKRKFASKEHVVSFTVPIFDPLPPQYFVRVVSDRWMGSEVILPMSFRHLILPEKFAPPTELLDLQPITTNDLAHEKWLDFFSKKFTTFNPIQTQVFNALYKKSTDSLLVAAPVGSGKTVIAELAMIRQLIANPSGSKIVYVAPLDNIAEEKYKEWKVSFERNHKVPVALLTGETGADLKLLTTASIIITTPSKWDILSRRWRTRKPIQDVHLFIIDELQFIAGKEGPTIEIIVSRMRYMASQLKSSLRIVGLASSLANAKDLGEWLGCSSSNIFNFHPASRPVPLEIRVISFDHTDFQARTQAMVKPAYSAINTLSPNKPVFVFVPNKKFAKSVAIDFMTFAVGENRADRFLKGISREALRDKLKKLQNATLLETLCAGIGFLHENMPLEERMLIESLYKANYISILVIEYSLCYGLNLFAHMSIVLGCQQYDSMQFRYVDIPINDVTAMIGTACRPTLDQKNLAVIYCVSAKKEFFKKFLYQPPPVESHLEADLADSLLAEIITKRVQTVQDAVDYLTWSFLYRRLTMNPNYYSLSGTSHRHFSDYLSELVENTLEDLQQAKMITIEDETELAPLNNGMISTYYYLHYTTVEIFARSLQKKTKLKGLLEILSSASEFDDIPVRPKEDEALRKLSRHLPLIVTEADNFEDAHTKTNILLQTHFSRIPLSNTVAKDLTSILPIATRLLQAMVDVLSSNGWLSPALACMELSQMLTQGMWNNESVLLQLPHFTKELATKCASKGVSTIADLMEWEDADRDALLKFTPQQLVAVANVCNAYPDIDVSYTIADQDDLHAGERATLEVRLLRDPEDDEADDGDGVPFVQSARYPGTKTEGWWLVLGNLDTNELLSIKRVAMSQREMKLTLDFTPSAQTDNLKLMLYLMSDSWLGVDQEYEIQLQIKEGRPQSDEDDEEEDSD